jgi:hypothetical protein
MKSMPANSQKEPTVPGGVYLCQVNEQISCGACCGLYNVRNVSFEALTKMLFDRTERFTGVRRDAEPIIQFGRGIEALESRKRQLADFYSCPFIGLVGKDRTRVGCLLHPAAAGNGGVDYRGLSYYGGMACRDYFCPSYSCLSGMIKKIVQDTTVSWYDYGLIITETKLLGALFDEIEKKLATKVSAQHFLGNRQCIYAIRNILSLKVHWSFRPHPDAGMCHYFFNDRRYAKESVNYHEIGKEPSKYDTIFKELGTAFGSADELQQAEQRLNNLIDGMVSVIQSRQ